MCGAEFLCLVALELDGIDRDHKSCSGGRRTLHRVDSDAADADDHHRVADLGSTDRGGRSPTGGNTAAEQGRLVERDVLLDLDHRRLVDGHVRRKCSEQAHLDDRLVVEGDAVRLVGDRLPGQQAGSLVADVLQTLRTGRTTSARRDEGENHVVAFFDARDTRSDLRHHSGAFVPAQGRVEGQRAGARTQMFVRMAQPRCGESDLHLTRDRVPQLDLFDLPRLTWRLDYRCLDLHLHSSKFFVMHGRRKNAPAFVSPITLHVRVCLK